MAGKEQVRGQGASRCFPELLLASWPASQHGDQHGGVAGARGGGAGEERGAWWLDLSEPRTSRTLDCQPVGQCHLRPAGALPLRSQSTPRHTPPQSRMERIEAVEEAHCSLPSFHSQLPQLLCKSTCGSTCGWVEYGLRPDDAPKYSCLA